MKTEADTTAKAYAEESIEIGAPTEKVFRILCDIPKWPQWQAAVEWTEIDGPAEAGKPFRWKAGGTRIRSKLHTLTPSTEIGWTGRILWITAVHNWFLEETVAGTRVTVKEHLKGFGSGMMKKSLQQGMRKNLQELKAAAEKC